MRLAPAFGVALAPFAALALTANVNGSTADVLVGANNCKTLPRQTFCPSRTAERNSQCSYFFTLPSDS